MRQIILDPHYKGNIVWETSSFEGDYDHLFKKVRQAIKERGLLGGIGQITGLSTNAGSERRKAKKEDTRNRKNLKAEAKANLKNSKAQKLTSDADTARVQAESGKTQAEAIAALTQQDATTDTAAPAGKKDNTMMLVGIGGAVLVIALVVLLMMRKGNPMVSTLQAA